MRKKINFKKESNAAPSWRPSATLATLRRRADIVREIRHFFKRNNVLEVDTPLLMPNGSSDPALNSFVAEPHTELTGSLRGFLQTSPEIAMKRLLAAGSGDIYQLCKAFRAEIQSRHHLPEFTLLEWYRIGFDHHRLMDDVEAMVKTIAPTLGFARHSYQNLFYAGTGIDPHFATNDELVAEVARSNIELGDFSGDRATLLDALFAHVVLRDNPSTSATFVYDFPVEQAAYARIQPGSPPVAQRFELLIGGTEIANGYFELAEAAEQEARHARENERREYFGLPLVEPDPSLFAALEAGSFPKCAGVAFGLDRFVMVCARKESVSEAVSFDPFNES